MRWGEVENRQVRLVRLHWHALPVAEGFDPRDLETRLPEEPGVYAFEGSHDGHPNGCVLYIGRAGKIDNAETLRGRTPASLNEKIGWAPPGNPWRPWAQFWNVTVRWARADRELTPALERLLIRGHSPPCNQLEVRGALEDDLVVLNVENKGRLLPVVASHYFHGTGWPDRE